MPIIPQRAERGTTDAVEFVRRAALAFISCYWHPVAPWQLRLRRDLMQFVN